MRKWIDWAEERPGRLWLCAGALSAVFLLFASVYTTPLNTYYGYDSPYYLLIGKGICQGKIPYLDLYDQKGPLVFYLNALGYLLTGSRTGVFLLQIVFMTGTLVLLWKLFRLFTDGAHAAGLILLFFALYCGTAREGDLVEEWSLIFSALPMYLGLRFLAGEEPVRAHPKGYSVVYGLCLGAHLMNRATNAALLCGLILAFAILLVRERALGALFGNAAAVLLGLGLFVLPWWLYLRSAGAWGEFVYAAFTHNFHYAANGAAAKSLLDWAEVAAKTALVPVTLVVFLVLLRRKKLSGRIVLPAVCMGLVGAFTMTMGYGLRNYFMNLIPVLLLDLCLWQSALPESGKGRRRTLAMLAVCLVFLLPYAPEMVRHGGRIVYCDITGYPRWDRLREDGEYVSGLIDSDRDSVWGYDIYPRDYLYADLMPCFRHFAAQSWMAEAEPRIRDEILEMLADSPPRWVLLDVNAREDMEPRLLGEYGYEYIDESPHGFILVYRRGEEARP